MADSTILKPYKSNILKSVKSKNSKILKYLYPVVLCGTWQIIALKCRKIVTKVWKSHSKATANCMPQSCLKAATKPLQSQTWVFRISRVQDCRIQRSAIVLFFMIYVFLSFYLSIFPIFASFGVIFNSSLH